MQQEKKPVCPSCGGSGEICFFAGESRFLLTREECPACLGLGYLLEEEPEAPTGGTSPKTKKTSR